MPEKKQKPKQAEHESAKQGEAKPKREDLEAELPRSPAMDPIAEPTPIGATRGPRPRVEPERD